MTSVSRRRSMSATIQNFWCLSRKILNVSVGRTIRTKQTPSRIRRPLAAERKMPRKDEHIEDRSPEDLGDLHASRPLETAAGRRAIGETITHTFSKMGPIRAMRSLLTLNQKGGIDCPSCAWPDPEDDRTIAEFCESGAKALADEAMSKHIVPEFGKQHDIEQLSKKEYYLPNIQDRLAEPIVRRRNATHYEPITR